MIPAIDTHIHPYDPRRPAGVPWPPRSDTVLHRTVLPADFRRTVASHRVDVRAAEIDRQILTLLTTR